MPDLRQDLQNLAERHADAAGGDFTTVMSKATGRGRRRAASWSAAACAVLAVGAIATLNPWQSNNGAPEVPVAGKPSAPARVLPAGLEGTMKISPETAKPGGFLTVTFPKSTFRGLAFTLSEADDRSKVLYNLTSDRLSGSTGDAVKPAWFKADDPDFAVRAIGVAGPGPDALVVPDTIADGTYLLCSQETSKGPGACGFLTVAR